MTKKKLATEVVPGDLILCLNELWFIVSNNVPQHRYGPGCFVFTYLDCNGSIHKQVVNHTGTFQVLYDIL